MHIGDESVEIAERLHEVTTRIVDRLKLLQKSEPNGKQRKPLPDVVVQLACNVAAHAFIGFNQFLSTIAACGIALSNLPGLQCDEAKAELRKLCYDSQK